MTVKTASRKQKAVSSAAHRSLLAANYIMPAEWECQEAVWLGWPHYADDWPCKLNQARWAYCEMIRNITRVQKVRMLVQDKKTKANALSFLEKAHVSLDNVEFFEVKTNRGWLRDAGPSFVRATPSYTSPLGGGKGGGKAMIDWKFNAWAKYKNWPLDNTIPSFIQKYLGYERIVPTHNGRQVVLEGGSIDVNGKGVLLTTEECLQSNVQCRNPGFTKDDYLEVFGKYLGIKEIIWLGDGIKGDDTHGHVDDIARFINVGTIAAAVETDKKSDNYAQSQENLKRLRRTKYSVVELPMPKPIYFDGVRLPASYANFLIINKMVLVPIFGDANDRHGLNALADAMPNHEVVGIYAADLVVGLGTIHCLTQQEPL